MTVLSAQSRRPGGLSSSNCVATSTSLASYSPFPTQYVQTSSFNSLNPMQSSQPYASTTVSSSQTGLIYSSSSIPHIKSFHIRNISLATQSTGHQLQGTHVKGMSGVPPYSALSL